MGAYSNNNEKTKKWKVYWKYAEWTNISEHTAYFLSFIKISMNEKKTAKSTAFAKEKTLQWEWTDEPTENGT